jgi:hypothetical protein
LQNRFEMAWWKLMASGQGYGRHRPTVGVDRNVDHSGNGKNALTRH